MTARLARALPDPPPTGACWADLGRRFVEFACAERLIDRVDLDPAAAAHFEAARARGGVLVLTAHLGNWELLAAALAARGYPVHAVAARPRTGPLHRWLAARRAALGVTTHPPGGGARAISRRLRRGDAAAIFIDQATGARTRPLPFFGRPAPTPTDADRLLAATGATPLWVAITRAPDGRYPIDVRPLPPGDPLAAATAHLEARVRATPAQWIWLHDRWRDDPG